MYDIKKDQEISIISEPTIYLNSDLFMFIVLTLKTL